LKINTGIRVHQKTTN